MVHVVSIGYIQVEVVDDERTWRCVNGDSVMDLRTPSPSATLLQTQFPLPYNLWSNEHITCHLSLFIRNGIRHTIVMTVFSYKKHPQTLSV